MEAVNEPFWRPLVPPSFVVPWNLSVPVAPDALPVPPVTLAVPWKVIVTGPLSPLEQPCEVEVWSPRA